MLVTNMCVYISLLFGIPVWRQRKERERETENVCDITYEAERDVDYVHRIESEKDTDTKSDTGRDILYRDVESKSGLRDIRTTESESGIESDRPENNTESDTIETKSGVKSDVHTTETKSGVRSDRHSDTNREGKSDRYIDTHTENEKKRRRSLIGDACEAEILVLYGKKKVCVRERAKTSLRCRMREKEGEKKRAERTKKEKSYR